MVLVLVLALLAVGCTSKLASQGLSVPSPPAGISLTVTEPQDNTITDVNTIEVKGCTNPEAVVSINEVMTTADANGNFTVAVNLEEGPNVIEVVASDEDGNQAEASLIVTFVKGG